MVSFIWSCLLLRLIAPELIVADEDQPTEEIDEYYDFGGGYDLAESWPTASVHYISTISRMKRVKKHNRYDGQEMESLIDEFENTFLDAGANSSFISTNRIVLETTPKAGYLTNSPAITGVTTTEHDQLTKFYEDIIEEIIENARQRGLVTFKDDNKSEAASTTASFQNTNPEVGLWKSSVSNSRDVRNDDNYLTILTKWTKAFQNDSTNIRNFLTILPRTQEGSNQDLKFEEPSTSVMAHARVSKYLKTKTPTKAYSQHFAKDKRRMPHKYRKALNGSNLEFDDMGVVKPIEDFPDYLKHIIKKLDDISDAAVLKKDMDRGFGWQNLTSVEREVYMHMLHKLMKKHNHMLSLIDQRNALVISKYKSMNYFNQPSLKDLMNVENYLEHIVKFKKQRAPSTTTLSTPKTRRRKTTTTPTTTTTLPPFDIPALVDMVANLTYDFEKDIANMFNETLQKYSIPTCKTQSTTTTQVNDFAEAEIVSKCFICGLEDEGIPNHADCADAFAGDFLPLVPVNAKARGRVSRYRKYCRYFDIDGYMQNETEPRSIFGRFTGGCAVRWVDLSGIYSQRTCRNNRQPMMGKHFVSKRLAKLELSLKNVDNGCIISPMASLTPFARSVSLYARFHACVCTGNWCNTATVIHPWTAYIAMVYIWSTVVVSVN